MKEFNAEQIHFESALALDALRRREHYMGYAAYIGLDVHKDVIAVSVARAGRKASESRSEIANRPKVVAKLVDRLNRKFGGEVFPFCYEAGPCGYGLYRHPERFIQERDDRAGIAAQMRIFD